MEKCQRCDKSMGKLGNFLWDSNFPNQGRHRKYHGSKLCPTCTSLLSHTNRPLK